MEKVKDFTEGKILPQLLSFAFPVLLALFLINRKVLLAEN